MKFYVKYFSSKKWVWQNQSADIGLNKTLKAIDKMAEISKR